MASDLICPNCFAEYPAGIAVRCPKCGTELESVDPNAEIPLPKKAAIEEELVEVCRAFGYNEAQLMRSLLEGSGIAVLLSGDTLSGSGMYETAIGAISLKVRASDAEAAQVLVQEAMSDATLAEGLTDEELEAQALAAGDPEDL